MSFICFTSLPYPDCLGRCLYRCVQKIQVEDSID